MGHPNNDGHSPRPQILIQPNIGLDSEVRYSVLELLNLALADEVVLTSKSRSAHWNVHGSDFLLLHSLFKTQSQLLTNISDEIAERARMLGGMALGSLQECLDHTRLKESPGKAADVLHLLADHEMVIRSMREAAKKCSQDYEDEGTSELLVSGMRMHEKMAWMLRSYLGTDPFRGESQTN